MLQVEALQLAYGDVQALSDVTLEVRRGEVVSVVGANGAGKTSLIRSIAGIHRPQAGRITYAGRALIGCTPFETCNLGVGQVAEGRQLFGSLSVEDNLLLGAMLPRARSRARQMLKEVYELFPRLAERREQRAGTLSGGEQQMVAIARCLMGQPELIMFDEPSLGLSPAMVQLVFRTIAHLNARGMTILLVEQNVAASLKMSSRAYVLENGSVVMTGSGEALLHDDRIRQAYLGL
jgi:branched-chain amino acid transport system ATP-binding protein